MTLSEYRLYFRQFYPSLLLYATRLLVNGDMEDVVQDAFVDLWHRRNAMDDAAHIKSFLYRAVYTKSLNVIKHRHVVSGYAAECSALEMMRLTYYDPDNNPVDMYLENQELREKIDAAINELPDKRRQIFKMSYLHGMSNKEIAQIMDISVRTVEAQLYKALKFLRHRLENLMLLLLMLIFVYG
ncbi:RNA polymerase sigma-70 factor [Prevotella sp. BV3P1]|uniref:RNA polymerase sigma70 factor n=1 Tax=Hoylesella buccalis DNF00853 TaxID=1401074 RepID=A0A096B2B7_9BACT|nr:MULTISPECIES: RNA polymerase sigma-70 factor [Prevotellaceae]ERT61214.1 RNA polymerase sigma-70 factor [Prevotella sp. BV3P1]KGF36962.1 RNA polymerase sigma70 factor [Hoylesella buccalis DNF00853]